MIGNVIHLPGRKVTYKEELEKFGGEYKVVPGVLHSKPSLGISQAFKNVVLQNIAEEQILIFEDDVHFTSRFSRANWDVCVSQLPANWDILLGGSYIYEEQEKVSPGLIKVGDFSSLHCVLINKYAYPYILAHGEHSKKEHLDRHLGQYSKDGELNVYLCDPQIAIQHEGYSINRGKSVDYSSYLIGKNILMD